MDINSINDQVAAARAAAAETTENKGVATTYSNTQVQPGKPVSLGEALAQGGMSVKAYLKVQPNGFLIGTDTKNLYEELAVEFRLSDVTPFYGLRFGSSPVTYLRSLDRLVEMKSKKSWAQCVTEAMQRDAKCKGDYMSADIPLTSVNDVVADKGDNKGKTLVAQGERLGLTLSVTNWKDFATFIKPYNTLVEAGKLPTDLLLRGTLKHAERSGNGNNWGAATFEDFLAIDSADATLTADQVETGE